MISLPNKINLKHLFIIAIIILSIIVRFINIDKPIVTDAHAFRQSQTAITVQTYLNEGYSLFDYQTPVLGYPYQIPMELPTYQTIVYGFMKVFSLENIDVAGRVVSILIFYISAILLFLLAQNIFRNSKISIATFLIYILLPFNIFWSRTFMIDYLSVTFALGYILFFLYFLQSTDKKKILFLLLSILFGVLGATTKITTMIITAPLMIYFTTNEFFIDYKKHLKLIELLKQNWLKYLSISLVAILPLISGIAWVEYADYIKSQNVFTQFLTSEALGSWNYGTMEQKLDISKWYKVFKNFDSIFLGIAIVVILATKHNIKISLIMIATIFITIAIFFNLYHEHTYYLISLMPFYALLIGIAIAQINIKQKWVNIALIATLVVSIISSIVSILPNMKADNYNHPYSITGKALNAITENNDNIITYGFDWTSVYLYSANRKGVMLRGVNEYNNIPTDYHKNSFILLNDKLLFTDPKVYDKFFKDKNFIKYIVPQYEYILSNYNFSIYANVLKNNDKFYQVDFKNQDNFTNQGVASIKDINKKITGIEIVFKDMAQVIGNLDIQYKNRGNGSITYSVNPFIKRYYIYLNDTPIDVEELNFLTQLKDDKGKVYNFDIEYVKIYFTNK